MKQIKTFEGLKVRPSYDELINLLDKPIINKYPARKASQLRNSHWLSQLDGDSFRAMDELHHNMIKEQEKEGILKGYATSHHLSLQSLRAHHLAPSVAPSVYHSADEFHSPQSSPRQATSPRQAQTPPVVPIVPSIQRHYISIPEAPTLSLNRKVKKHSNYKGGKQYRFHKGSSMFDTSMDEKMEEQHDMDVDEAEIQRLRSDFKDAALLQQYRDMATDINVTLKQRQQAMRDHAELLKNNSFEGVFSGKNYKQQQKNRISRQRKSMMS